MVEISLSILVPAPVAYSGGYQVGDRVRHYGTQQWGRVLEVKPWPLDDSFELRVNLELRLGPGIWRMRDQWWSSRRLDQHEPLTATEVQLALRRHDGKIPYTASGLYLVGCIIADGLDLPRELALVEESICKGPGWIRVRVGDRWFGQ